LFFWLQVILSSPSYIFAIFIHKYCFVLVFRVDAARIHITSTNSYLKYHCQYLHSIKVLWW
jgi:hypothetical protein